MFSEGHTLVLFLNCIIAYQRLEEGLDEDAEREGNEHGGDVQWGRAHSHFGLGPEHVWWKQNELLVQG